MNKLYVNFKFCLQLSTNEKFFSFSLIPFTSRVRVEYYVNENTFKERLQLYFIKNQRSSKYDIIKYL